MTEPIGELFYKGKGSMLKMWYVTVPEGKRQAYRHFHTRFEISVVTKGSGVYLTDKDRYVLEVGDVMVFPSNEIHTISEVGEGGLSITNLQFEPIYIQGRSTDTLSEAHLNFCFSHSPEFKNRIPAERAGELRRILSLMEGELFGKGAEYPLMIRSYLNLIIIELLRSHNYGSTGVDTTHMTDMVKVMKYIDSRIAEKLTLEELSSVAGMTPTYFSALFKRLNGISPWEYITTRRIEQAVRLITSEGDMTMLEVALSCGFNNTANFNKAFKSHTGITPSFLRANPEYLSQ